MTDEEIKKIVDNITGINSNLEGSFVKMILHRLYSFGYKSTENDCWCLSFCIDKSINKIKNACNITIIPNELKEVLVDRICGEFLFNMKQSNQLEMDKIDLDMAVKSIQEGDTNVTFAINEGSSTDEAKLNSLINYLLNCGEGDLICYRKLKW